MTAAEHAYQAAQARRMLQILATGRDPGRPSSRRSTRDSRPRAQFHLQPQPDTRKAD